MIKTINVTVGECTYYVNIRDTITSGDHDAYQLRITAQGYEELPPDCRLHFVSGKEEYIKTAADGVTIEGNVISYMMDEAIYSNTGLCLAVKFSTGPGHLFTPFICQFTGIRIAPAH